MTTFPTGTPMATIPGHRTPSDPNTETSTASVTTRAWATGLWRLGTFTPWTGQENLPLNSVRLCFMLSQTWEPHVLSGHGAEHQRALRLIPERWWRQTRTPSDSGRL